MQIFKINELLGTIERTLSDGQCPCNSPPVSVFRAPMNVGHGILYSSFLRKMHLIKIHWLPFQCARYTHADDND